MNHGVNHTKLPFFVIKIEKISETVSLTEIQIYNLHFNGDRLYQASRNKKQQ